MKSPPQKMEVHLVVFIFVLIISLAVCIFAGDLSRASAEKRRHKRALSSAHLQSGSVNRKGAAKPAGSQCCACGKAHYKITFIANWKRQSHPRHFPGPMARWSPMIGCSHSSSYVLWRYGMLASLALQRFSEWGDTSLLQHQMGQRLGKNVLKVIKMPALWSGDGKTSARFTVDHEHNLLSVIARLTPSPDWNVGVDSLNLCDVNCTWVKDVTVDLHAWDAGTDDGIAFVSVNKRTTSQQPIQRIDNKLHSHPRSSLYRHKGETREPFGQLRVERRHISGNCGGNRARPPSPPRSPRVNCVVTKWSSWTPCSRCSRSPSVRVRGRVVITKPSKDGILCPTLRETKSCRCGKNAIPRDCKVGNWSNWSACTTRCGRGKRIKSRVIIQKPSVGGRPCPSLFKLEKCRRMVKCKGINKAVRVDCLVSEWSNWSLCPNSCNRGTQVRARNVQRTEQSGEKRCRKLWEKRRCVPQDCTRTRRGDILQTIRH